MANQVKSFCSKIGCDPLLVQGAGGNVSWKDGEILWIKASGTWLADAELKEIFVPVDLASLRNAIACGNFSVTPTVLGSSSLRPSIETLLHALMPHPIVVHLHAVEVLAHLVRKNWLSDMQMLLNDAVAWTAVPYKKPGADLAAAVNHALQGEAAFRVVFLQNHGIVIGGNNIAEIEATLKLLVDCMRTTPIDHEVYSPSAIDIGGGYIPVSDPYLHYLAKDLTLFARLDSQWTLYPDHVVFLGPAAQAYPSIEALHIFLRSAKNRPELIFIKDVGVFVQSDFSLAKILQLRCYYEVLVRQQHGQEINTLRPQEIGELLNWDAEQYRLALSK
ncbi:class II aldolase/adducin family protein [Crenobacter sp. SG2303]|uniref:Class II aldolase/adducin family protein n=1 Tax=Crenobacter oryzisoli TaxID=3056844 RepID=A0ABT7XSQ1_9NEIS|nr:class II aldolase/adducin family protein [Crenobacter sp. SG2303]MDN0076831.1 class II aldolase/adducin family protein [Crenobacter sp. SG2303]